MEMLQFVVPLATPRAPVRSFDHMTRVTPTSSAAVPPTVIEEDDVVRDSRAVGPMYAIVGPVLSGPVLPPPVEPPLVPGYVTFTVSTPELPAASNAGSVMTFVPFCSGRTDALLVVVPDATPLPPRSL